MECTIYIHRIQKHLKVSYIDSSCTVYGQINTVIQIAVIAIYNTLKCSSFSINAFTTKTNVYQIIYNKRLQCRSTCGYFVKCQETLTKDTKVII